MRKCKPKKPDFAGWTTIENLKCEDGREKPPEINPQFFRVFNLFGRVTYKPGTRIVVEQDEKGICVQVWIPTVDANNPEEPYDGRFFLWADYALVEQQTDDELVKWLMHNVATFETHEVMEFFKLGGEHVMNPHPYSNPFHGDYMKEHGRIWALLPKGGA